MAWKSTTGLVTIEIIFMRLVAVWGLLSSSSTFKASRSHFFPWGQPQACWAASPPFAWHHCHLLGHSRCSRVCSTRGDLPEGTLRELEELEQRVKSVEEEYWKSLDPYEAAIERKCAMGLACLQVGMMERAADEYTAAADSRPPDARSWPLGLVLFYLGRYDEAIARLETDIQYFEDRFDESATDERIWQAAAKIQAARAAGKDTARVAKGLPPLVKTEPNALRRTTYEMFRLEAFPQELQNIANVATGSLDHLGVDFFSKMFLGLWHDAHGNEAEAKSYILAACCSQYPRSDDLWFHTPRIHARARGWELSE